MNAMLQCIHIGLEWVHGVQGKIVCNNFEEKDFVFMILHSQRLLLWLSLTGNSVAHWHKQKDEYN